jgi:hypothetical protein
MDHLTQAQRKVKKDNHVNLQEPQYVKSRYRRGLSISTQNYYFPLNICHMAHSHSQRPTCIHVEATFQHIYKCHRSIHCHAYGLELHGV